MSVIHSVRRGKPGGTPRANGKIVVATTLEPHWHEQVAAVADRNGSSMSGAASLLIKEALEARQAAREATETA